MYYDIHTHLDMYKNSSDVVKQINKNEIFTFSSSVDIKSYRKNKELALLSDYILPTFGIHPSNAFRYANNLSDLDSHIIESPVIGEIGLDYLWVEPINRDAQIKVFQYLAQKAIDQDKYIVVHTKNAELDILNILTNFNAKKVIVHWYSGPIDIYKKYMSLGWYSTFGVELKTSSHIQNLLRMTPKNRVLTETDNPVGVEWLYGKAGNPSDILSVYDTVSKTIEMSIENLKYLISVNVSNILMNI